MSKMKKNRKKLFAILLQAALVSTAMTRPAYAAKTPGIGSDALIGDDATGPVLTGGNTEVEEETSPYTKEQLEDGTLEYGEIAWRIEGYNSTYLNLRSQLYSQTTSQSAGTALAAEASALMEDAMDLKSDDMDAETRERFVGYKAAAQSYEAAKRQNALGMLSRANYLGLECSWLSSVASYKSAELEYTKAVENYEWAVKGLIVTN